MNLYLNTPNYQLAYSVFSPNQSNGKVVLINPAMGVPQRFYADFAQYLADLGFYVYTFDYYGMCLSAPNSLKNLSTNLQTWAEDIAAMLDLVKTQHAEKELIAVCHSVGGQLFGQVRNNQLISKLVLVACQGGYWKFWSGLDKLKVWIFWHLLIPPFSHATGYFPAKKLGLFENLPKKVALQWAQWGRSRNYFADHVDTQGYQNLNVPLLSMSFSDDFFAPPRAAQWLNSQYKNCQLTHHAYTPQQFDLKKIGHFDMFKTKFKPYFWQPIADFISG
jgi:predicted alpha/beta hydrolase